MDERTILAAAVEEYWLEHPAEDTDERIGRRSAIRGLMVRLGLYADFNRDSAQRRINHMAKKRQETVDDSPAT